MSIYVEIDIHTDMETLWNATQTPEVHARWDLRFTEITYLPRPNTELPQRFLYATRIGFGLSIHGEGETVGMHSDNMGGRVSALKFWSADLRSLILEGSGFWKYEPHGDGIRFFTRYDYHTRFGWAGKLIDKAVFRPLMGWATAWSFDSLRLWLEKGIDPELSRERSLNHALTRVTLAFIWLYQGIVPKLLFRNGGELQILRDSGFVHGMEGNLLSLIGIGEIVFGILLLACWRSKGLLVFNIVLLLLLTLGVTFSQPRLFIDPFNPVTLNVAMGILAIIGMVSSHNLPSAANCLRRSAKESL